MKRKNNEFVLSTDIMLVIYVVDNKRLNYKFIYGSLLKMLSK